MPAEPFVLIAEFRTANDAQHAALLERLEALALDMGLAFEPLGEGPQSVYDAPELAGRLE